MKNGSTLSLFFYAILALSAVLPAVGQRQRRAPSPVDTAYVRTFPRHVVGRLFLAQKYTNADLLAPSESPRLKYRPNTKLNLGVGATYGPLTVNLGYGFGFLNNDTEKGRTRSLDLQSHLYTRKWVIDLFGQFYNGYYLAPQGTATPDPDAYYQRPDARLRLFGLSGYRIFNPRRFSYRAALTQIEWQRKSAGSWLAGLELYTGTFRGDSSLVPGALAAEYPQPYVREIRFVKFGPGGGYAYTQVIKKRFFVTGSLTLNLNLTFSDETSEAGSVDAFSLRPNLLLRAVAGYNSNRWIASVAWVENSVTVGSREFQYGYLLRTGTYRLTLARRFVAGKRLRAIKRDFENKKRDLERRLPI